MLVSAETFIERAMENPVNAAIVERLPKLGLRQCFLTAGCLFQTIWNQRSGCPLQSAIKDYDVFYFDDTDLSWDAEDAVVQQTKALFSDLGVAVEVKNQARVHLWYEQRFGHSYPRLQSAKDGIDHYLISCTCVGIDIHTGDLYAPNGLQDLWDGVLKMNPMNPRPDLFQRKAEDYQARWPWLTIAD
ncbi:nucleotidyltransferase family protein [Microvirga alba]|uniref:Nucleotidyltransferase family protein n=1 Tax=Microvirga alba TaxID=2791025 RepID=A0A931BQ95_9HYPH|nr:nucleotidyltransferase family protein [Microvirga alba]MBF9232593.1 nucleotidyltransferase family protein [Microvirga alba]